MTTHASQNGASATAMEFEATHHPYGLPETEDEWENPYTSHLAPNQGEMEDEWEHPGVSHQANPYNQGEMEDEWEHHPYASHLAPNTYNQGEMEDEWEHHPYNQGEMEDEWEHHPYNQGEMEDEWEHHPYNQGEMEDEWEHHPYASHLAPNPYNQGEMEDEWEHHPYTSHLAPNPYNQGEMEDETDNFIPLLLKGAKMLLPHAKRLAMRVGRNLLNRSRRPVQQSVSRPSVGRDQQIAALFRQLGNVFAQGESMASAHEAELFGSNEFETEVASHPMAHQAALAEMLATEATHTESESEAQALLAASVPLMINVVRGGLALRQLTPSLVQLNARLVLNLRRQGRPGRQLLATVPAIQHRTLTTLQAIQRTGQPITPALASRVMAGQTMRVLSTPRICGRVLVRNAMIRRQTVAPRRPSFSSPNSRTRV